MINDGESIPGWWFLAYPSEKYDSQLGWFFPIYGKIKNIPNHQPAWDFYGMFMKKKQVPWNFSMKNGDFMVTTPWFHGIPAGRHRSTTLHGHLLLQILGENQDAAVVQRQEPGPLRCGSVAAAAQAVVEIGIHHLGIWQREMDLIVVNHGS